MAKWVLSHEYKFRLMFKSQSMLFHISTVQRENHMITTVQTQKKQWQISTAISDENSQQTRNADFYIL